MKHTLPIILLFISLSAIAQPQAINYQGVARDSLGHALIDHNIGIRLSILDSSNVGSALYVETHNITTNSSGLFNISIGLGNVVSGIFSNIPWGTGDKWLKIEMDAGSGTNYQLIGVSQFLSVPYALHAKVAESISDTNKSWTLLGSNTLNNSAPSISISFIPMKFLRIEFWTPSVTETGSFSPHNPVCVFMRFNGDNLGNYDWSIGQNGVSDNQIRIAPSSTNGQSLIPFDYEVYSVIEIINRQINNKLIHITSSTFFDQSGNNTTGFSGSGPAVWLNISDQISSITIFPYDDQNSNLASSFLQGTLINVYGHE